MLNSVTKQSPVGDTAWGFWPSSLTFYLLLDYSFCQSCRYLWRVERRFCQKDKLWHFFLTLAFYHCVCVQSFSPGIMTIFWRRSSWFSALLGIALFVLTAGNIGPNHDRRQATSSSCFGGFDLYFVLDKWVMRHIYAFNSCIKHNVCLTW